jgi:hypothetical protein
VPLSVGMRYEAPAMLRQAIKAVTPPLLWSALSTLKHGTARQSRMCQGVTTLHDMSALHSGQFADAFDRAAALDPWTEPNDIRLRLYFAVLFAQMASDVAGDLSIGGYLVWCRTVPHSRARPTGTLSFGRFVHRHHYSGRPRAVQHRRSVRSTAVPG